MCESIKVVVVTESHDREELAVLLCDTTDITQDVIGSCCVYHNPVMQDDCDAMVVTQRGDSVQRYNPSLVSHVIMTTVSCR